MIFNLSWASASLDLIRVFAKAAASADTLYGAAKDSLRRTFLTYCNVSGLPGSWGRAFFKYGPRENPARLVS
jgi:hypothetical protein